MPKFVSRKKLALVALVAMSLVIVAAVGPKKAYREQSATIVTTTLDAASTTFSITDDPRSGNWERLNAWVTVVDADDSVTLITMICTGSKDDNTTNYSLTVRETSSGVSTFYVLRLVHNPAVGTARWLFEVDVKGVQDVKCVLTDTGGDESDSIQVDVTSAT